MTVADQKISTLSVHESLHGYAMLTEMPAQSYAYFFLAIFSTRETQKVIAKIERTRGRKKLLLRNMRLELPFPLKDNNMSPLTSSLALEFMPSRTQYCNGFGWAMRFSFAETSITLRTRALY
jgi:hypothetical protein